MGHGMKSLQEIRTLEIKQQQAEGKLDKIFKLWPIRILPKTQNGKTLF